MRLQAAGLLLRSIQVVAWGGFVYLWVRLSLKDWKDQKILHRDLRAAAIFVAASYGLLALSTALGGLGYTEIYYSWAFYKDLSLHLALSCAAALALWGARIWPAGDAKLFMFLAALLPLLSISGSFASGGLFFMALVNVFLPACAFVFAQVVRYLWITRFSHQAAHLMKMGLRRGTDFALESVKPALAQAVANAKESLSVVTRPRELAQTVSSTAVSFALMAAISMLLKDVVPSPSVRTLVSFLLIMGWSRFGGRFGMKGTAGVLAAVAAVAAAMGPEWRAGFWSALTHISVFGVFMMFGVQWTMGAVAGKALTFVLPLLLMVLGMMVPVVLNALGVFPGLARQAAGSAMIRDFGPLAAMGLFFGLCYVLVRIWEDEDRPEIPLESVKSYMVLHPSFLEKLEAEAPDFYETHFASTYADGITADQTEALLKLCRKRKWPAIWIQKTMSFAHWIFLGYFLTWLLRGHVLQKWL